MVRTFGDSGAWKSVLAALRRIDPSADPDSPSELTSLIEHRSAEIVARSATLAESLREEAAAELVKLGIATQEARAEHDTAMQTAQARADVFTRETQETLDSMRSVGFLRRVWRRFRVFCLRLRIKNLLAGPGSTLEKKLRTISAAVGRATRVHQDPQAEAHSRLTKDRHVLHQLRDLAQSPESRGAHGELSVIHQLRRLPDDYVLLNDLNLQAPHFMRHAGKALESAQVDHVVVGPAGVFLLETKAWTLSFSRHGWYFDPYEQVSRAGLLCHALLNDAGLPAKVQNVIVTSTRLPRSAHAKFVQVVPPHGLPGFILARQSRLGESDVEQITSFLRRHLGEADVGPVRFTRWLRSLRRP
ncbi:MAG: nuclease-related domain-containing protein [Planctomycetota bacterium]